MPKTVLAVDVGASTITAAVAGGDLETPQVLRPRHSDSWPAAVYVDGDGTLITDEYLRSQAASVITRFTQLLGREAVVIAGAVRHADTLVSAALTPVLATATRTVRANIDIVVATYPSTWPESVVAAYRHAIAEFAPAESSVVAWSDAVTAATLPPQPFVDCPITSLDFGARSASVTMVRVDQHGNTTNEYSITNPCGGFAQIARPIIAEIADSLSVEVPGELDDLDWWDQAVAAFAAARTSPAAAWKAAEPCPTDAMIIDLPEPVGIINVSYREVTELIFEQLTRPQAEMLHRAGFAPLPPERARLSLLEQLLNRGPVQGRWTVPGNPHAARPLVEVTGGFANDPAVLQAVRAVTASEALVVDDPSNHAVRGAALLAVQASTRLIGARR